MAERAEQLDHGLGDLIEMTRGRVSDAITMLDTRSADPIVAVHRARKSIRSARALLRLARSAMAEALWSRTRGHLRDASSVLSAHRDAHVLCETFDDLADRAGVGGEPACASLREALLRQASRGAADLESHARQARGGLCAALRELGAHEPRRSEPDLPASALRDSARRARRDLRRQMNSPSAERVHELRKRCRDLREQMNALSFVRPKRFGKLARGFDRVAGLLGRARDIAVLLQTIENLRSDGPGDRAIRDELIECGSRREAKLERRGVMAACEALARPPSSLARDVRRGW